MHKFSILKAEKPVINGRVCWVVVLIRSPAKASQNVGISKNNNKGNSVMTIDATADKRNWMFRSYNNTMAAN